MKLSILALAGLAIILTALAPPSAAQRKTDITTLPVSDAPYTVGERLTYNVSYSSFVSAGYVELFVAARGPFQGRDAIQLRAHVETTGVVSAALYSLNNDYTSFVDPGTGLPFRVQHLVRDAGRTNDTSSDFNQPGTYDFLSALYRLRTLPLAEGATYSFSVRSETQEYQAELRVKGRETVKTSVGSFNTIVSQILIPKNPVANDYRLQVYFSDDERHVPVLIKAKLRAGEIQAELAGSQLVPPNSGKSTATNKAPEVPKPTPTPVITNHGSSSANAAPIGLPFKAGEQLNYRVYLASVQQPVGIVSYQVRARGRYFDHDGLMLTVGAHTTEAAQRLFVVNDQLTTYVEPQTLLPFRCEAILSEGKRRTNETWTINQDHGVVTNQSGKRIEIPVGTHDYLSVFYALRAMNLVPPRQNAVSILVNGRPKTLIIKSQKRETIQLETEKIPAIQLALETDDAQPDKFAIRAWISDDDRRLPLRLTATTELGPLRAELAILPLTPN